MATVRAVVNFRVKPGREADLFEGLKMAKRVIERLGGSIVVNRQTVGPETGHIIAVGVYDSWAAYAKVAADPEWRGLIDTMRNSANPAWEEITTSLNEEIAL